jgi:UDP-2,3-diacylglucosamine hydrolase
VTKQQNYNIIPDQEGSLLREKKLIRWLDEMKAEAEEIYLMGDLFDFWFEYKSVAPKGYVRLLGKLAELTDSGIKVNLFTGNHDMWLFDYLPKELNVKVYRDVIRPEYNGRKFYLGHRDGIGPGDHGYKFFKKVLANKVCQWLFVRLHPNLGFAIANYFSKSSRIATGNADDKFLGDDKEWLVVHCKEELTREHFDYFIFGHRHLPLDIKLNDKSRYINLGDKVFYLCGF